MKKITLLLVGVLISSSVAFGQTVELQQWMESQYQDASHRAFIYAVSPQTKAADIGILQSVIKSRELGANLNKKFKGISSINNDTTWTFKEHMAPNDSVYKLSEYSYRWTEGEDFENARTYFNHYYKNPDSTKWYPKSKQLGIKSEESPEDSSIVLYYDNYEETPYYGFINRTVKEPTNNADYEYYRDSYSTELGWFKYEHGYSYRNENGRDTLTITEKYNQNTMMYTLESERRYNQTEDYAFNSSKYFNQDSLNSIYSWNYDYTKFDGEKTIYQVVKRWNSTKEILEGTDSLYFDYKNGYVEGRGFQWSDSVWIVNNLYRSYQTNERVDSIINYSVYPDSLDEFGNIAIDDATSRTEFYYDANGNQVEIKNYYLNNDGELALVGQTKRAYKQYGENYVQVSQETFAVDYTTKELYKSGEVTWVYDDEGVYKGNLSVNLNSDGDTTYGYGSSQLTLEDGTLVYITIGWDYTLKQMAVQNYRAYPRSSQGDNGYLSQSTYFDPRTNSGNRSISIRGKMPAVMNDGPLNISMGDTLLLYVSARNIDFTIPEVTVTNMPASATFDPETRRFYWIVDEENPSPMTYTATNSKGSSTVNVEFVNVDYNDMSNFVSNEEEDLADRFSLTQNYPNPFNPSTTIKFNLPQTSEVSLKVYNMLGQEVATLVNGRMGQGLQAVTFDASSLASGMYIYRLQAGSFQQTKKMMLIK